MSSQVGMAELALDDVERHRFSGELYRVRVAQLVRREASPNAGGRGEVPQFVTGRGG